MYINIYNASRLMWKQMILLAKSHHTWWVTTICLSGDILFNFLKHIFLYNLRLNNSYPTPFNGNYSNKCSENSELPPRCYLETTPSVQFVRDAVYSLAYALQDIYKNKCRFNALCLEHRSMIGEEIRKHLIDVQFEGK